MEAGSSPGMQGRWVGHAAVWSRCCVQQIREQPGMGSRVSSRTQQDTAVVREAQTGDCLRSIVTEGQSANSLDNL